MEWIKNRRTCRIGNSSKGTSVEHRDHDRVIRKQDGHTPTPSKLHHAQRGEGIRETFAFRHIRQKNLEVNHIVGETETRAKQKNPPEVVRYLLLDTET